MEDLGEWIQRVDELGELTRVAGADPDTEIGSLVDGYQWDMETPALLTVAARESDTGCLFAPGGDNTGDLCGNVTRFFLF